MRMRTTTIRMSRTSWVPIPSPDPRFSGDLFTPRNYRDILDPLWKVTGGKPGLTLDIGSNTTWFAQFVTDYHGVDIDRELVERSRKHWVTRGRWSESEALHRIVLSQEARLPFESGRFDTVMMRDVLEHVGHAPSFFGEAVRVLRPGGVLFLSCPDSQRHVWDEPTHLRPYPIKAQLHLGRIFGLRTLYRGYESVMPGTQWIAGRTGGRTPLPLRLAWRLRAWPRNAVTIQGKNP